jgi:hypothetical protein
MIRPSPRAAAASLLVVVACSASAADLPARVVDLRYRFRTGDSWRERVLHEVEVRDEEGEVVSSRRTERTDVVEIVSVEPTGRAKVKRRPEPSASARESPPEEPFEYAITARGAFLGEHVRSRFAPVLPLTPLAKGETGERKMSVILFRDGGGLCVTETATLADVERSTDGERARLALRRRLGEAPSRGPVAGLSPSPVTVVDAVHAPEKDAWLAVPRPARARLEFTGLAGEGELVFDTHAGKPVSYSMLETTALEARLVTPEDGAPLGETLRWTVTVRYEIKRAD